VIVVELLVEAPVEDPVHSKEEAAAEPTASVAWTTSCSCEMLVTVMA